MPEASEGIALSREGSSGLAIQGAEEAINPRVELPDEMLFISAQDANLDIDEPEEQIVVVKRRDDPEDRIRIVVADFDTLRNTYRITWEGKTLATNIRTFAVSSQDLIGDHVDEIVGVGTDRQGRQTMDVFRRQQDEATATGIAYERIFSVATDGSIEIASQQRSDSYRTLQSNGRSFPIDVYRQNRETETPLDLIMTRWTWNV
ncbi:MAG: pallilysin-related adhesin, partial [Alkalispirochaeta sp.]